jgi:hypothetical protein
MQMVMWATLGLVFGALTARLMEKERARPRPRA